MENTPEKNPAVTEKYDASDIQVLEGMDAVRKRPGMYIGSTGPQGLHHLVYEIVDNAIDEVMAGYCTKILVDLLPGDIVRVKDNGRGIPVGIQPKLGIPAVTVVFTVLHAGGKFGGGGYKVSGGLHGVGASVVNALSEWLEVEVCDGHYRYYQRFEYGKPVCDLQRMEPTTETGSQIAFKADPQIFTETTTYDYEVLLKRLREQAFLNGGVNITFTDQRGEQPVGEVLHYQGGIRSFVTYLHERKKNIWDVLHEDVIYFSGEGDRSTVEVALQYNDSYNTTLLSFANDIHTGDGGTHEIGFRTALLKAFNDYAKKTGVFKKESDKYSVEDVLEGLTAIISVKLEEAQFEGQTPRRARLPAWPATEPASANPPWRASACRASWPTAPTTTTSAPKSISSRETRRAVRQSRAGTAPSRPSCRCGARCSTSSASSWIRSIPTRSCCRSSPRWAAGLATRSTWKSCATARSSSWPMPMSTVRTSARCC